MAWTKFFDMSSGGGSKTEFDVIFIELPEEKAKKVFEAKFGLDAENVTCPCCGCDFSVYEVGDIEKEREYYGHQNMLFIGLDEAKAIWADMLN